MKKRVIVRGIIAAILVGTFLVMFNVWYDHPEHYDDLAHMYAFTLLAGILLMAHYASDKKP